MELTLVIVILSGLLVCREALSYKERKRLMGMIFSKTVGDLKYLEEDEPEKREYTNPILEQRKKQSGV